MKTPETTLWHWVDSSEECLPSPALYTWPPWPGQPDSGCLCRSTQARLSWPEETETGELFLAPSTYCDSGVGEHSSRLPHLAAVYTSENVPGARSNSVLRFICVHNNCLMLFWCVKCIHFLFANVCAKMPDCQQLLYAIIFNAGSDIHPFAIKFINMYICQLWILFRLR